MSKALPLFMSCLVFLILGVQNAFAFGEAQLFAHQETTAVKGREGVNRLFQLARLYNDRALFQLSYDALVGKPLAFSVDKQIEGTRRPWAPYKPLPTVDKLGYASLGLDPSGNWDGMGFFDLLINDIGLMYVAPTMREIRLPLQVGAEFIWENSQARVTQTFLLREGDDKLLMQLRVEPQAGISIERLVLRLRNAPRMGNTVYGNPATRRNAIATVLGEREPAQRVELNLTREWWIAYYNKDLGASPSGLLFLPNEVEKGHLIVDKGDIQTTLYLAPKQRVFHFAFWEKPQQPNGPFIGYLQQNSDVLRNGLAQMAGKDWTAPLPPIAEKFTPLHLTDTVYTPTPNERTRGYVLSRPDDFEYTDANTLPTAPLSSVALTTARRQTEGVSFNLYSLRDLGEVTLQPTELVSASGKKIPVQQCDLRVMKVWLQRIDLWGGATGEFAYTPELLVRNDLLPLKDVWPGTGTGATGLISGPVVTSIPRDVTRQFRLMVTVPAETEPGIYQGKITVTTTKAGKGEIPVALEVLPITLRSADDRYILGIYYRGKPFPDPKAGNPVTSEFITRERFTQDMHVLHALGFNAITSFVPSGMEVTKYLDGVFPILQEQGFRSPVIVSGWGYAYNQKFDEKTNAQHKAVIETYLRYCKEHGYLTPAFYGIDEPTPTRYNGIETTRKRGQITREVTYQDWRGLFSVGGNTLGQLLDVIDYPIVSSYFNSRPEMKAQCEQSLAQGGSPLYYWQIWGEYPKGTRLNCGYFLYASGYRGVFPYSYQHFDGNPYIEEAGMKPMMLVYPSVEGPVFTLQSEAARSGFNDLRYLVTLDELLKQVEARSGAERVAAMQKNLSDLLKKYGYDESKNWGRMIYGSLNWPEHQKNVPNRQFDQDRRQIIAMILECQQLLK